MSENYKRKKAFTPGSVLIGIATGITFMLIIGIVYDMWLLGVLAGVVVAVANAFIFK